MLVGTLSTGTENVLEKKKKKKNTKHTNLKSPPPSGRGLITIISKRNATFLRLPFLEKSVYQ